MAGVAAHADKTALVVDSGDQGAAVGTVTRANGRTLNHVGNYTQTGPMWQAATPAVAATGPVMKGARGIWTVGHAIGPTTEGRGAAACPYFRKAMVPVTV